MISNTEEYAKDHQINFSTHMDPARSKTKCNIFCGTRPNDYPDNLVLKGDTLPCVSKAKYLGMDLMEGFQEDTQMEMLVNAYSKRVSDTSGTCR